MQRTYDSLADWLARVYYATFPKKAEKKLADTNIFDIAYKPDELVAIVKLAGEKAVLKKLSEEANQGSTRDCHQQSHQIGVASYKLYGADAFKRGDTSCLSGFYHCIMGILISEWGGKDFVKNTKEFCGIFDNIYDRFECLHGIGHGIMAYEDYNMPAALHECEGLTDEWWKGSCYGGIFHENVAVAAGLGVVPGHDTKWVNKKDLYFPCNTLKGHESREFQCYQVQTGLMLTFTNYDFKKVSGLCANAPKRNRQACFISFGRDIGGVALREPKRIVELCGNAPEQSGYYADCIDGALRSTIIRDFRVTESNLIREGMELCASIEDKSARESCETTVTQREKEAY